MKGTREIKGRMKAVKNTAQITRAMQLVAASKMKRWQDRAKQGRPYATMLAEMILSVIEHIENIEHPFLQDRPVKNPGVLVISTDRGLCGSLNTNLFRLVTDKFDKNARFVTIGKKATQFLAKQNYEVLANFTVSDQCAYKEMRLPIEYLLNAYTEGKIDSISVLFPRFLNTLVQRPAYLELLPMKDFKQKVIALEQNLSSKKKERNPHLQKEPGEILFEPNITALFNALIRLYLKEEIHQMILEAKASEHSARMVAMKTATENAKELVDKLSLEYNKVRQAAITQEILEIAAAQKS